LRGLAQADEPSSSLREHAEIDCLSKSCAKKEFGHAREFRIFCYTFKMDIKDVENLAQLARIELTEEEKKDLLSDMDSILGYVKQVEDLKVENAEPELNVYNVWREDSPRLAQAGQDRTGEFSRDLIIKQFPDSQDGFLKVKKIL